jgi:hypothetical protein
MPTLVDIQADTTIRYLAQTVNYDLGVPWIGGDFHWTGFETKEAQTQVLYRCDFSGDVTAGHTIDEALLYLYVTTAQSSGFTTEDYTWKCDRIRRAWVEDEATDLVYTTGNNWGTAGAENAATDRGAPQDLQLGPVAATIPCWWVFDVTEHCVLARSDYDDVFNAIIDPGFALLGELDFLWLGIEDRLDEAGHTPYLSITHSGEEPPPASIMQVIGPY